MTWIKRLVPVPLLSAGLVGLWLALARSTSLGQVVLGMALGLVIPFATRSLRPAEVPMHRPLVAVRYLFSVGRDVIASTLEVAWGVVSWGWRKPDARFVTIPLELRDPLGLAVLSMVTTIVPGTVWSELALDRSVLRLHVWDVGNEEAFVARFKQRYEQPLREIFE